MSELKLCPFCGSKETHYFNGWKKGARKFDTKRDREPSVTCEKCGIGMSFGSFGYGVTDRLAKKMTIDAWNRRVGG